MAEDRKSVHTDYSQDKPSFGGFGTGYTRATVTDSEGRQGHGYGGSEGEAKIDAEKDLNGR